MERQRRVKFSVEFRSGSARFRVGVQAKNIPEAMRLVGGRHPQGVIGVAFPAEQEGFLVHQRTFEMAA